MKELMLKERLSVFPAVIRAGESKRAQSGTAARAVEYALRFLFGFTVSKASVFGAYPFGIGLAASCGLTAGGLFSVIGVSVGYLTAGGLSEALRWVSETLIIYAAVFFLRGVGAGTKSWFPSVCVLAANVVVGLVYNISLGMNLYGLFEFSAECAVACTAARAYRAVLSPASDEDSPYYDLPRSAAIVFLCASVLIALDGIRFFGGVSMGRIFAVCAVLTVSYGARSVYGCPAGAVIGLAMDASASSAPFFTALYAASALVFSLFGRLGKYLSSLAFVFSAGAFIVWFSSVAQVVPASVEVFSGVALFLLLPARFVSAAGALFPVYRSGAGAEKVREYAMIRIEQTASAFSELCSAVRTASGDDKNVNDVMTVFDRAAQDVCRNCIMSAKCWQYEYENTRTVMTDLIPAMLSKERLSPSDVPEHFSRGCRHIDALCDSISREAAWHKAHVSYKRQLLEKQDVFYSQYTDISSVLKNLACEIGGGAHCEPELERRLTKYVKSCGVRSVSAAVYRDRSGRLHAELNGRGAYRMTSYRDWLERLSIVLEVRLCTPENRNTPSHIELMEAEPFSASVGTAYACREGQALCGDVSSFFKTDEGFLYVLLSDGMGTGKLASDSSRCVVRTLERFLRAGTPPDAAVRILNSLFLLKNDRDTVCATVDLLRVDLFTGEALIFKCGAAPSYIKHKDSVRKLSCDSLTAGMSGRTPDPIRIKLSSSTAAVIISDGVTSSSGDKWLMEKIMSYDGDSPRELAHGILSCAREKGASDDMSVLTVFLSSRK